MPCLEDPRVRAVLLALVLAGCAALVAGRLVRTGSTYGGDSVHYFAQVRSIVLDRDLDLSNEFERLHEERSAHTGNRKLPTIPPTSPLTGRPGTMFPVGTAILLIPFFLLGHLVASVVSAAGGPPADGFGPIHSMACGLGAVCYAGLAITLLVSLGRRSGLGPGTAFAGALAIFVATPWLYYATLDPLHSHAYAAFAVTLFFWILLARALPGSPGWWWLALGASGGLLGLVRYQDIALVLLAPAALAWNWRDSLARPARTFGRLAAFALGVLAVVAIQLGVHRFLYGSFFETGHREITGQGFDYIFAPRLLYTAFSAESGFLRWSPVIALSFAGVWFLRRRRPLEAALCGAALAGQWYVMSAWCDLAQGDSFGNRHFVSDSAFLALGLMETVRVIGSRWPRLATSTAQLWFLALAGGANLVLMGLYSFRIVGNPY